MPAAKKRKKSPSPVLKKKESVSSPVPLSSPQKKEKKRLSTPSLWFRFLFLSIFLSLLIGFLCVGAIAYTYARSVATHAGVSIRELVSIAKSGWTYTPVETDGRKQILLLGLDKLSNRDSDTILTDTIMVISLNTKTGHITTFSFPRDLFLQAYDVKINALYSLGQTKNPVHPEQLIQGQVEQMTGLPIHHVVIVELDEIGKMIDALGGIDVTIDHSFTDQLFPREDVDVRVEKDPRKLYKTVSFTQGTEHMNGQRALEFIRSRHSSDPTEGTDDARVRRQQQVLQELIKKLEYPSIVKHPDYIGLLLKMYREDFQQYLPLQDSIAVGKQLLKEKVKPQLVSHQFSIKELDPTGGVFYHPDVTKRNPAWVYLPVDPSWKQIKSLVQEWINK